MKKKLVYSAILVLALVLTSGTFAYTYSNTAATTLNGTFADGAWATYQPSASQPDWQQVIPGGVYEAEILRPVGSGDDTEINDQFPDNGPHWQKVDETSADDYTSYLTTTSNHYQTDLYDLSAPQASVVGVIKDIKSITVFFRVSDGNGNGNHDAHAKAAITISGDFYEGVDESITGANFTTRSYEWRGNPSTGKPWTWDEVTALEAGVSLKGGNSHRPANCTQVYVAVNYEKKITQSEVPEGNLFDVTPHPDYTGDLQVKVYLTNTAALIKAYSYLNIELRVEKSIEARKVPPFQLLTLDNGVATFNIEGGAAKMYTIEVWGGAYRLVSPNVSDWAAGWSVTPELYCEVSQR